MELVDAHHHFWDLGGSNHPWLCQPPWIKFRYGDYAAIRRNYLLKDYLSDTGAHTLLGSVHVEAEWHAQDPVGETRWLSKVLSSSPHPVVLVVQARLDQQNVGEVLNQHAAFEQVRGVRHKPCSAPIAADAQRDQPGSMDDPNWRDGYARLALHNFSFDLQTPYWHLDQAADLARDFPDTRLILNHTGMPLSRHGPELIAWRSGMEQVARQDNTAVKISGLGLPGQRWDISSNRQVIHDTIAIFGIERTMFASNFPVDRLCVDFNTLWSGFAAIVKDLPRADQHKLFCTNARSYYRIPEINGDYSTQR